LVLGIQNMQHTEDFGFSLVPNDGTEFSKRLKDNFWHFINLQNIIKQHGGVRNSEGSYFMDGRTLDYCPRMYEKQSSLYDISKGKKRIIEVGVNAGHSLLIMLLASEEAIFDVFDICMYGYTIPCIAYLNEHFSNRVFLHQGDSKYTLLHFIKITDLLYDLFHIDGMHNFDYVDLELSCALSKTNWQSHIVVDDYCSNIIKAACDKYEDLHLLATFKETKCYAAHRIFVHELSLDSMYL
jgi:hypothetical protein